MPYRGTLEGSVGIPTGVLSALADPTAGPGGVGDASRRTPARGAYENLRRIEKE